MRTSLLSLLLAFAVAGCSSAAVAPSYAAASTSTAALATAEPTATAATATATQADTSPSATRDAYAAMTAELQAELNGQVEAGLFTSLSAAIVMPDGRTWTGAAGPAVIATGTPATPDTSYGVGSITKTFVAALVLELAEDGVLRLDDTVGRWLPQLRGKARFSSDRVTIRQLLSHTSGIANYTDRLPAVEPRTFTPEQLLEYAGEANFAPGTDYSYSNTNYVLAGMIIEKATGSRLGKLLHQRILDPLHLDRTRFQTEDLPAAPAAHGYVVTTAGAEPVDAWDGTGYIPNRITGAATWAAGGMTSTASDLASWARALYGGNVLDAASLEQMLDFERYANLPHSGGYGLGAMEASSPDGPVVGHLGNIGYFQGAMWYATGHRVAVAVLSNSTDVQLDAVSQALYRIVLLHLRT